MFPLGCVLYIFSIFFKAVQSCPGGVPLFDGACPDFECHGPLSCNNNGNCNSDGTACECKAGFSGPDCSFNLEGENIYVDNSNSLFVCL